MAQRGIALRRRILFLGILFGGKLVFSHSGWKGWNMRRGGGAMHNSRKKFVIDLINIDFMSMNRTWILVNICFRKNRVHELKRFWNLFSYPSFPPRFISRLFTQPHPWRNLILGALLRAIGWYIVCWVGYGFNLTDLYQSHTSRGKTSFVPSSSFFLPHSSRAFCRRPVKSLSMVTFTLQISLDSWQSYFTKKITV